jgi:hypothetical protein
MSMSFGHPPLPRWYFRTLSAIALASGCPYHASGCRSTSCHRTGGACAPAAATYVVTAYASRREKNTGSAVRLVV